MFFHSGQEGMEGTADKEVDGHREGECYGKSLSTRFKVKLQIHMLACYNFPSIIVFHLISLGQLIL